MNYTMTREKNIIALLADGKQKPYKFDINTGVFYGLNNKPIKACPAGLGDWINSHRRESNVLFLLSNMRTAPSSYHLGWTTPSMDKFADYANFFRLVDRLESIGFTAKPTCRYVLDDLKFVEENFKAFAKYVRENDKPDFYDFRQKYEKVLWMKRANLKVNDYITEDIIEILWDYRDSYPNDKISLVAYYITHGLYDFFNIEPQSNYFRNSCNENGMFTQIRHYFEMCEKLNITPQKEDFLRSYVNVRRTYLTNRKEFDKEALINFYSKQPALNFEDDTFTVVLPTSREDFLNEANSQENCVYSMYMPKVLKGTTYVVFIRRKDNLDKSYVTCEVSIDGHIQQYLTTYNRSVTDPDTIAFKKKYAEHLRLNWAK